MPKVPNGWIYKNAPKLSIFTAEGQAYQPGCKVYTKHNAQSCQPSDGHAEPHQPALGQRLEHLHGPVGVSREQTKRVLCIIANPEVCWQDKWKRSTTPFTQPQRNEFSLMSRAATSILPLRYFPLQYCLCLNLPFKVTTYHSCCCLLAPNVLAIILQALSLSTSVDVARNNHTLLPALVTTCTATHSFFHQQTDFIATTTSALQPFKHRDNYHIISLLAREKAKRGQLGWGRQHVGEVPSGDTRREATSFCRGMDCRSHLIPKHLCVSASSSSTQCRGIRIRPNHSRAQTPLIDAQAHCMAPLPEPAVL